MESKEFFNEEFFTNIIKQHKKLAHKLEMLNDQLLSKIDCLEFEELKDLETKIKLFTKAMQGSQVLVKTAIHIATAHAKIAKESCKKPPTSSMLRESEVRQKFSVDYLSDENIASKPNTSKTMAEQLDSSDIGEDYNNIDRLSEEDIKKHNDQVSDQSGDYADYIKENLWQQNSS